MSPLRKNVSARAVQALALVICAAPLTTRAQEVNNTSYVTSVGERVLRLECTIPAEIGEAWKLFSTGEGLKKWIAPVASIDLRVGGQILTNYDLKKSLRDSATIRLPIINYLEGQMMTLRIRLNDHFPARVRREDGNLQEIVLLQDLGGGRTRVTSSMVGWGTGPEWDKAYAFFAAGNEWTYQQLVASFRK